MPKTVTKICSRCKERLTLDAFRPRQDRKVGVVSSCRHCESSYFRAYRAARPDETAAAVRRWRLKEDPEQRHDSYLRRKFKISRADYDEMLTNQDGSCAVCFTDRPGGVARVFHVDHCHETGKIRGLLCLSCNVVAGHAKDDPDRLRRMAAYLEATR